MIESFKSDQDKKNEKRKEKILELIRNGMNIPQDDLDKVQKVASEFKHNRQVGIVVNILGTSEETVKIEIPLAGVSEYDQFWAAVYPPKKR